MSSALLAATAALALPLALAWACVPGAALGFDRPVYEYRSGDTVTVLGRAFAPTTQVALTLYPPVDPPTLVGNGVLTDAAGFFRDSFTLPASAAPGPYLVVATVKTTDVDGHGRTYEARESFRVLPPPAATVAPVANPPPAAVQPLMPAPTVGMVFNGTAGADMIVGTPFADVITCGAGADVVRGGGGRDVIDCGAGDDRVDGGAGDDRIVGGPGSDRMFGGAGDDELLGGAGRDVLRGGAGGDALRGGSGRDVLRGGAGGDRLFGGPGRDMLYRGRGDALVGGPGRDRVAA